MTDRAFVDTNVWIYAVDGADAAKRERALEVVAPAAQRDLVVSTQVLTEFYAVATRKLATPVPAEDAELMVGELSLLPVVAIDASLVAAAITGSREWRISIWDALIIRAAEVAGCRRLLSEDLADGTSYGAVVVENPFRDLRSARSLSDGGSLRCITGRLGRSRSMDQERWSPAGRRGRPGRRPHRG